MRLWKATSRAVAAGVVWATLWAGIQFGYGLLRYGALVPRGPGLLLGPVAGFLGGFAGTLRPYREPGENRSA
ncbi:hypothetical protein [Streptomyces sp. NPDC005423]|uniref:hypothetical protein n=1 Tax=Streptomyces sp. NPDC005423 TaxID=3155343 RepID=UPI0033BE3F5E